MSEKKCTTDAERIARSDVTRQEMAVELAWCGQVFNDLRVLHKACRRHPMLGAPLCHACRGPWPCRTWQVMTPPLEGKPG